MDKGRLILTTWNIDNASASVLLTNFFSETKSLGGGDPFFVDAVEGGILPQNPMVKDTLDPLARLTKHSTVGESTSASFSDFKVILKELVKKKKTELLEDREVIFLAEESLARKLCIHLNSILVFIRPEAASASFLYKFLKTEEPHVHACPKIYLVITGMDRIESAALAFTQIKNELTGLFKSTFEVHFSGFLSPDMEKLNLAQGYGMLLTEAFPGDSFHGQIKYIWKNLENHAGVLESGTISSVLNSIQ